MRSSKIKRDTLETQVNVSLDLDGAGSAKLATGLPFLDHMLDQVARHGMIDLEIAAKGDLHIDAHHTVEDVGISLGRAVAEAVGDKRGIRRYGHAYVPLDEALSRVVIDFSGRPGLVYQLKFSRAWIGEFDVDLVREFFQGFANHAQATLHIDNLRGDNAHHQCETVFKAFGRALRMAVEPDPRAAGAVPSTKGSL
ncbi:MAG: imidazoleglycerol-phosphate dehydratase HisB [Betaproteobacteria bacterium]|nr:MAG: imidazoleglycerol-phosphate dehydratase HisB [Betaproteobacteria bacterium]